MIVLNHLQTEDLLEHGKTFGKGRIKGGISSLATGTAWNGMPSHVDGGSGGFTGLQGGVATSSSTKATKAQTKAVKDNTKATKGNSKSKQKEAEVIDWVEVRLERLGRATDNVAKTITDFVSKVFKKTQLKKQIAAVQKQIEANIEGQKKYEERAKKVKFTKGEAKYRDKVLKGEMEIEDIKNEDLQKKIADYKEWTEKALDCRDAVQELRNTQIELFADWAHIPTEYAEKKIDKLTAKYDELENKMKTASGSGSKVAAYAELQADRRATELEKVQKNIDSYNTTAQQKVQTTSNALATANSNVEKEEGENVTANKNLTKAKNNLKKQARKKNMNKLSQYTNKNKEIPKKVINGLGTSKAAKQTKKLANEYNKQLKALQKQNTEAKDAVAAQKTAQFAADDAARGTMSLEELQAGRTEANRVYQDAKTDAATKKKTRDEKKKTYDASKKKAADNKVIKKNKAAKNAIDNGTKISDSTLKALKKSSKTAYNLAKKYNDDRDAYIKANNAFKAADAERKDTLATLESFKDRMADVENASTSVALDMLPEEETEKNNNQANRPSYEFANQDIDEQISNLRKQATELWNAYVQTQEIAKQTENELDTAKDNLKKLGNAEYNRKIEQGENIIPTGKENEKTLKALTEYNMALERNVAAQEALLEADKNSKEADNELVNALVDKPQEGLDNIEAYFSNLVDWYQNWQSLYESEMANKKSLGLDLNEDDFKDQIKMIEEREKVLLDDVKVQQAWLDAQVNSGAIKKNSEDYRKMQGAINDLAAAANKASDERRELEDEMRVELYIKPIDDAIEKLNDLSSALGNVNSMIVDAMKYDDAGRFTDYGLASLAVDVSDYNAAREEIEKLIQKRNEYIKQFKENDTDYAESEFLKDMTEVEKAISQATVDADGKRRKVISSIIAQAQEELKVTGDLIKAEKTRYQKQKTYQDYDRKLRDQNKELQMTKQQLAAIEGITDAESKAAKARLEAQRAEQEQALQETIEDHVMDIRLEGLDDLSEQLQKNFEEWSEDLSGDLQKLTDALYNTTNVINESMALNNQTIEKVYSSFGINGLGMTSAGVSLIPGEPIKFNDATYTPLDSSQVFTAPTFTMGIPQIETLGQQLAAATEKSIQTIAASATGGNTINNYNIQSMFDVAGNLDSVSAKQVVDIIANKYPDIFAYVAKEMKNGHIQAGYKI